MRRRLFPVLGAALACACASYDRGPLAAASTVPLPLRMTVVERDVEGRACGDVFKPQFNLATQAALETAPGANALVNVSYRFERFCMVVQGTAVRLSE